MPGAFGQELTDVAFHSPSAFVFYGLFAFLIVATILAYHR